MISVPEEEEVLEFYRFDVSRDVKKTLGIGVVLLTLGPPLVLFAGAATALKHSRELVGFTGAFLMMSGLVTSFFGIGRLLFRDHYVSIRSKTLDLNLGGGRRVVTWDEIEGIELEGDILRVKIAGGEPLEAKGAFAPERAIEIVAKLKDLHRKKRFGNA